MHLSEISQMQEKQDKTNQKKEEAHFAKKTKEEERKKKKLRTRGEISVKFSKSREKNQLTE